MKIKSEFDESFVTVTLLHEESGDTFEFEIDIEDPDLAKIQVAAIESNQLNVRKKMSSSQRSRLAKAHTSLMKSLNSLMEEYYDDLRDFYKSHDERFTTADYITMVISSLNSEFFPKEQENDFLELSSITKMVEEAAS